MSAGLAILKYLKENPSVYNQLNQKTEYLIHGMRKANNLLGLDYSFNHIGSMFTMFFTNTAVDDFESAKKSDLTFFASYFQAMLSRGIYLAPSQFESLFISTAITTELADQIIHAHEASMKEIHSK
jgi:glutamate-1-semialdehyde 2,1-aminomutase